MPDISQKASLDYWNSYPDSMIFRVIALMESMEKWVYDGDPTLEQALKQMGDSLEGIVKFELKKQAEYLNIGNHIHMGRILRIMQAVDTTHPGSASRLLMYAEENTKNDQDPSGLFLRRNIVFERLRLLARVFSQERLLLVQKALEKDDDNA
ncbi:MAG: phosphoesterase [Gammaproteobacteria bacterium RIFCSPHIGHO2_12_FULL_35_23]|nr:MAG: phosphoesterase [Gammaproteobacteria bacterium RIFCSPHIGHO2_12_FULL_35_23]